MAKKKNKNQNKGNITEFGLVTMLPGMLMSAKLLTLQLDKQDMDGLYPGKFAAAVIISAHCAELLLKYKIKQERHSINWNTHNLHYLYQTLNTESKAAIQKKFDEQLLSETPPNGWESAESVFQKTGNACKDWRYAVEPNNLRLIYPRGLYIAAASVYQTIPTLKKMVMPEEVTDPAIKAEVLKYLKNQ